METKTYTELLALIQGLCGVTFATSELPRIQALVNRRALRAYRASNYWTRFLTVGEERAVTSSIIPYAEGVLDPIDTFLSIHRTAPHVTTDSQEFKFFVTSAGATLVCGDLNPSSAWVTYKSRLADNYGSGGTDEANIPKEWFAYLAHGVYADFLRSEGQQEKSALADLEATDILTDELMLVDDLSSFLTTRILTNSNSQTR